MAEKGGKGFSSLSKGKTISSSGKGGGKESNLSTKQGRKISICTSSSSESEDEGSLSPPPITPSSDKWGKGGKAGFGGKGTPLSGISSNGKAGKSSSSDPSPKIPTFEIEGELGKNVKCMMDCEALDVLERIQESMVILSENPDIKLPESFIKGLQYAKSTSCFKNPEKARHVLEELKKQKVSDTEICLVANICPESVDELFALMPNLKEKKKKNESAVKDVLGELAKLKSA
ncbi:Dna-directed rna polymerase ii subunit [Thalictrum thalictroides]|uniref:Dna-directed rna polymerase ii subunit n=1 Tax=Thalictrum thalictroides TaxID=46969 RepID=A0A7J6UZM0_THATH|nr:Dna-directed rna polymerase ii subunit [Thalictrum thalictroides]